MHGFNGGADFDAAEIITKLTLDLPVSGEIELTVEGFQGCQLKWMAAPA